MGVVIAFIQLLLIFSIFIFEYRKKSPALFLWGALLVMFGLPHFLSVIQAAQQGFYSFSDDILFTASLFSIIFSITYLYVRLLSRKKIDYTVVVENKNDMIPIAKVLFIILICTTIIDLYIGYRHTGSLLNTSWTSGREVRGDASPITLFLGYIESAVASVLLIYIILKKRKQAVLVAIIILLGVIISRQRAALLPIFICLLSYFIILNKRLTISTILAALAVVTAGIYFIFALQVFRWGGTISSFLENFEWSEFNSLVVSRITEGQGEFNLRNAFYYFIQEDNQFYNFGRGHTYIRALLLFIPTQWSFGLKPPDFAITMGTAWNPFTSTVGFSMHPTLLGDLFANFNFWGCLIGGVIWGGIINLLDLILKRLPYRIVVPAFVASASSLVIIGRGSVYNALVFMVYSILFLLIVNYFVKIKYTAYPLRSSKTFMRLMLR